MAVPRPHPARNGKKLTFSTIIAGSFFVFTLLVLVIPGIVWTAWHFDLQQNSIRMGIDTAAERAAGYFNAFIATRIDALEYAAALSGIGSAESSEQSEILSRIVGSIDAVQEAGLVDLDGEFLYHLSAPAGIEGISLLDRVWTESQSDGDFGTVWMSEAHIDPLTHEPHVVVSIPVLDIMREQTGSLVAEVSLRFIWDFIGQIPIEYDGYAYIADTSGTLIAHADIARVLGQEDISAIPVIAEYLRGEETRIGTDTRYAGLNGEPVQGKAFEIESTGWALVVEIPWNTSYRPVVIRAAGLAFLILALAAVAGIIGILIARRISVPISALTKTAAFIAETGSFEPVRVHGPREIEELSAAFECMTAQLQSALESLKAQLNNVHTAREQLLVTNSRLSALIDHSPMAITMVDTEGIVILWNRTAEELYGWSSDEIVGRYLPILPEDQYDEYIGLRDNLLEHRHSEVNRELLCRVKSGLRKWISLSIAPVEDDEGTIYGIMNIASDITEQKKSREQIAASLHEKEVLLKEIHHRVKNNMQIISSLLYLQEMNITDPGLVDVFRTSQERIRSMGIIHEQLYMSENIAKIDFRRYIHSLADNLFSSYVDKADRIGLEIDADSLFLDIETAVPCGLIINELLTNSMKHAFPGNKHGAIRISMKKTDGRMIRLLIEDDGIGFRPEERGDAGTSLGLTLVRELTGQLHGVVEFDSAVGTSIEIRFPEVRN